MKVTLDVRDIKKAISDVRFYELAKKQGVKDVVNKTALNIQRKAKKRLTASGAVDTGRLRASVVIEPYNMGFSAIIGTDVFYAPYIEFGTGIFAKNGNGRQTPWIYKTNKGVFRTRGQRPRPFLFPSYEEEWPLFILAIKKELGDLK